MTVSGDRPSAGIKNEEHCFFYFGFTMSIEKVAKEAGVSNATVSYVINNKGGVSEETAQRVRQAIKKLNYIPRSSKKNAEAGGHTQQHTLIGLALTNTEATLYNNPFYSRLFHQLDSEIARRLGSTLLMKQSEMPNTKMNIEGCIFIGFGPTSPRELNVPFITVLGHNPIDQSLCADHIEPDNIRIGALAAKYLLEKGHRYVGFFHPHDKNHVATNLRKLGFFDILKNVTSVETECYEQVIYDRNRDGSGLLYEYEQLPDLQAFMKAFVELKKRPTALFIPSDSHMVIFQNAFHRHGIRPGRDIELIGCNNEVPLISSLDPRPATIDMNSPLMAKLAVDRLIYRMQHPQEQGDFIQIQTQPTLIEAGYGVVRQW